jgi:uncharacterized protein (DUF488 family)
MYKVQEKSGASFRDRAVHGMMLGEEIFAMKHFTIGYGGRKPAEVVELLYKHGVRRLVDVRLRPDRASMGVWVKAKTADRGIEKWLGEAGIRYESFIELGNLFLNLDDWEDRYRLLLRGSGELLTKRLIEINEPYCLLCSERRVIECHRRHISELVTQIRGDEFLHIE